MKLAIKLISTTLPILILSNCGIYSFSGASISSEIKTVSIEYFDNRATNIQPTLSQVFTEKLKDQFLQQTNLKLIAENGDLNFSGNIIRYDIQPIAVQANESASQNRLTISVSVEFTNTSDGTKNFTQTFSRYNDYLSSEDLTSIEINLIEAISDELIEDIFNKAIIDW